MHIKPVRGPRWTDVSGTMMEGEGERGGREGEREGERRVLKE